MQRTESVEVKATLAGADLVAEGITKLGLTDGDEWQIVFFEDVTHGIGAVTPLLDLGVALRARAKGKKKGDSTVKLRPCRWSQLVDPFRANFEADDVELKVEADWSTSGRTLAASLTADWEDGRLAEVQGGRLPTLEMFTARQREFLRECSRERIDLASVTPLGPITATRWPAFEARQGDATLSVRAERWLVGSFDFLELSVVSTPAAAVADQDALTAFVSASGLRSDPASRNKTERVVSWLVANELGEGG